MLEFDKGDGWECGLWIAWFVYQRCAHRGIIHYLQELASPGRGSLSKIKVPPQNVRALSILKIINIIALYLLWG